MVSLAKKYPQQAQAAQAKFAPANGASASSGFGSAMASSAGNPLPGFAAAANAPPATTSAPIFGQSAPASTTPAVAPASSAFGAPPASPGLAPFGTNAAAPTNAGVSPFMKPTPAPAFGQTSSFGAQSPALTPATPAAALTPGAAGAFASNSAAAQGNVADQQTRLLQYYQKLAQMGKVSMLDNCVPCECHHLPAFRLFCTGASIYKSFSEPRRSGGSPL